MGVRSGINVDDGESWSLIITITVDIINSLLTIKNRGEIRRKEECSAREK